MPKMVDVRPEPQETEGPGLVSNYGLRLCLNEDVLEKLGLDMPLPIGATVQITANAVVVAGRMDGDATSMELQIVELGLDKARKTAAGKLYPSAQEAEDD
jgi:hypothetical protein